MIINSLLDQDLYKISMMNFVFETFPDVSVEYRFKNRGAHRFDKKFFPKYLKMEIENLSTLQLEDEEYLWTKKQFPYLSTGFLLYLKNFRYNPENVSIKLTEENDLELIVRGRWLDVILYEVQILSIISEIFFITIDQKWSEEKQYKRAKKKIKILSENGCNFIDFGTRRRRSFSTQETVLNAFVDYCKENKNHSFLGTSNLFFAKKLGLKAFGSVAHEQIQATQVLNSFNHCNYYAMESWIRCYENVEVGTALTDTVGVDAFLRDFNRKFSILYPSIRQDSGDPFLFVDKMIAHYEKMRINPLHKTIIFSDNLNLEKTIKIKEYCEGKIQCSFGIGTFLTNDFPNSKPLNMVIKLWSVNDFPVIKLSDEPGKESGEKTAIEFMKWIINHG